MLEEDAPNGLKSIALGIEPTTQCSTSLPRLPSTDVTYGNQVILMEGSIFSFGGKSRDNSGQASNATVNFKYELFSNQWLQIEELTQRRYLTTLVQISRNEIFITG